METAKINGHNLSKTPPGLNEFYNEIKLIRQKVGSILTMVMVISAVLALGIVMLYDSREQPAPKMELLVPPGSPVDIRSLPDGVYRWVDGREGSFLVFVQSEAENPLDQQLFAVISFEQIPPIFVVEGGKVKEWIPEIIVKNPLAEEKEVR